ncbi:LytTR family DNA-binding domain-containing protein [Paenibacillus sp. 1011MAR3C5]|uniref:LytTR family DNA-binding domain-containing protein n=1 Tax=Paenibacillus sp. 1011MAR3C5 TaxID=1675787 RepID=UPI001600DB36|nr:LytTR family DNA-binding domain-containing protein [Paenibacillus sp. 1011MAR3C5]
MVISVNGENGLVLVKIKDIHFIECDKRKKNVLFHTTNESYHFKGTLSYWIEVLNQQGFTFKLCDRTAAINMNNITYLDPVFSRACFDNDVGPDTKWCNMSRPKYEAIMEELNLKNRQIQPGYNCMNEA